MCVFLNFTYYEVKPLGKWSDHEDKTFMDTNTLMREAPGSFFVSPITWGHIRKTVRESEEITLNGREVLFSSSLHISGMCLVDPVALPCGEVVYHGSNVCLSSSSEAERQRRNQGLNVPFSGIPCSMTHFFPHRFHLLKVPPSLTSGWQTCLWVTFHILTM